jgi:putative flippase GtrA
MDIWLAYKLRLSPVPAWVHPIISYGAVGAFCACASNAIVIGCSLAGLEYWQAAALSLAIVTPVSYVFQSRFTFGVGCSAQRFIRFGGSILMGAFLFLFITALLRKLLGMPIWVASPLATVIIFYWNYIASRWAITKAETDRQSIRPQILALL